MKTVKELQWKSRRGMKELDILFDHYLTAHFEHADTAHQQAFSDLADMQDPKITDYLFRRDTPDSQALTDIIDIMREYSQHR